MFGEIDGAELEELAESLLSDIIPNLETSYPASYEDAPKVESPEQQLSGSMVGSSAELLESSRNTTANSFRIIPDSLCKKQKSSTNPENDQETVYGTYDETTNSIMIVMADGTKQIAEDAVQEIASDVEEQDEFLTSYSSMDEHSYVSRLGDLPDTLNDYLDSQNKPTSPSSFDCSSSDPGYGSFTTSPPRIEDTFNYEECINWNLFPSLE